MKSCRKHNSQAAARPSAPASRTTQAVNVPVHRYSHPIRSKSPASRASSTEELLAGILESLSRQSELLEELLRRTGGDNSDTK